MRRGIALSVLASCAMIPSTFAAPAHIADPAPRAYRDDDGRPHGPGGPISAEPRDCSAAHDHCMRGGGYIGSDIPVFLLDGKWYRWHGEEQTGAVDASAPATAASLRSGRHVWVFRDPHDHSLAVPAVYTVVPRSEQDALGEGAWHTTLVSDVDEAHGTFVGDEGFVYAIGVARVAR
jgi:hypothetical protein